MSHGACGLETTESTHKFQVGLLMALVFTYFLFIPECVLCFLLTTVFCKWLAKDSHRMLICHRPTVCAHSCDLKRTCPVLVMHAASSFYSQWKGACYVGAERHSAPCADLLHLSAALSCICTVLFFPSKLWQLQPTMLLSPVQRTVPEEVIPEDWGEWFPVSPGRQHSQITAHAIQISFA